MNQLPRPELPVRCRNDSFSNATTGLTSLGQIESGILETFGAKAARESVVIGSAAIRMALGAEHSRLPRGLDIIVPEGVFSYLREQPGWQDASFADGRPSLKNGSYEVGVEGGTWPSIDKLRQRGWSTSEGVPVAGLADIYAWKQDRGTSKDTSDNDLIRTRLHDHNLEPLPARIMPAEIEAARTCLPEYLLNDPEAETAVRLIANGLFTIYTLYGHPGIGRCNQIIGGLELPEYRAVATYHNGFNLVGDQRTLQRHFDRVPGITNAERLDGAVADAYSDAVYGNGRKSHAIPGGHDELRSARLAKSHAQALGYPEERAQRIEEAILDTEFDEQTGTQRGAQSSSAVGRALAGVDLQILSEPDALISTFDIICENGTSARSSGSRVLGKCMQEQDICATSTENIVDYIDEHPTVRLNNDHEGQTLREWFGIQFIGNARFHHPATGYQAPKGWTLEDPQMRIAASNELTRIGGAIASGDKTAKQGYQEAQDYAERWHK